MSSVVAIGVMMLAITATRTSAFSRIERSKFLIDRIQDCSCQQQVPSTARSVAEGRRSGWFVPLCFVIFLLRPPQGGSLKRSWSWSRPRPSIEFLYPDAMEGVIEAGEALSRVVDSRGADRARGEADGAVRGPDDGTVGTGDEEERNEHRSVQ